MLNASGSRALLAAALLLAAGKGAAQPAATPLSCAPGDKLAYVCGPAKPEDIVAIPGTPWLIASGFSQGAGLKLVDGARASTQLWFTAHPEQLAPDRKRYASCPGPVDPALFNARGLSLRRTGPERFSLHVVNHGGRESIEVFDVTVTAGQPMLRWRGCLPMPEGLVANSVATFSDGTVLATVLNRPGATIADFVLGNLTGAVYQWAPGDTAFRLVRGTELPGNNGLETAPDDRHFYVVAFGWHAVVVYDRKNPASPKAKIMAPGFMPDNIHWTDGRLLVAGMRLDEPGCGGLRKVVNGVADGMLCHRGYVVAEVDPRSNSMTPILSGEPEAAFNGVSAAALSKGRLWIGSYQSDRLAYIAFPEQPR
ncbi:MAG: hypothetical protein BGP16_15125 [Sphingobium sp. 66-54]|nr:MAG: hypothetical protein BGP16_15125 [Sphingobium sp. 66-54]